MDNSKKSISLFLVLAIACPVVAFGIVHWYENKVADLPYYGENYQPESSSDAKHFAVGNFTFPNESGTLTTLDSVKGKVWIANYFFTYCKTICPIIMPNLTKVQAAFRNDPQFRMLSFSVDPERDSVARLKVYAGQLGIGTDQWHLLTGEKKLLYRYARNALFITATDGDGGADDFIHSDKVVLLDQKGHIRGYYDGTSKNDISNLIRDIHKLLKK